MLDASNLLCCTTILDADSFTKSLREISELLISNDISRKDTTIYLSLKNDEPLVIHIYIAIKKKIVYIKDSFWIKERILFVQAVKARYEGELYIIRDCLSEIMQYLAKHKLSPITPFCCKVIAGLEDMKNTHDMIVDIYVGVNGNIF